ncbi:MAG TPA: ABC transporter transmembrane domain-containing protein, partial [Polyangiaceae bacterium]|nr:ABC transporter transmembrane domain-containing protein [Polyangiaceae bacterium]
MLHEGRASLERAKLSRILSYFRPYRRQVFWVMGSIALAALAGGVPPLLIKRIVDRAIPEHRTVELLWLCVGMVVGPLLAGLLGVAHKHLAAWIGEQVMYDLRLELFSHVQRQSLAFFANAKPGEVISRVLTDVQGIGQALQDNLVKLLQNVLVLSVSVALIVSLDWRLALVAMSALPLFVFPARKVGRQRKQLKRETQARMAELTGILMETLSVSGVLLIKVFGTRKRETQRLRDKALELQAASLRQNL